VLAGPRIDERDCSAGEGGVLFAASQVETLGRSVNGETVIVVPCYNEAARLDLAAFGAFLSRAEGVSLVMVDDGSTDGTPHLLERLRAAHPRRVGVLGLGTNVGKAEAVRRGVKVALRRAPAMVGYWDADLATPLEAICEFRAVLAERADVVLVMGSRVALLGRQIRRSWKRHLLGRAFATAASLALGLGVYDTQCGAKLFRVTRETAALFDRPFRARWIFDVEILARMVAASRVDEDRAAEELIYEYPLQRWQDMQGSRLKSHDFLVAVGDLAAIHWVYLRKRSLQAARPQRAAPPALREAA
jgi:dolichyl-phosphate beta-glucosyltransferase